MSCSSDGCKKPVEKQGLCAAHRKRRQRGGAVSAPVREYGMEADDRLQRVAIRLADAEAEPDGDEEFERASALLRKYAQGYAGRARLAAVIRQTVLALVDHLGLKKRGTTSRKRKCPPAPPVSVNGEGETGKKA